MLHSYKAFSPARTAGGTQKATICYVTFTRPELHEKRPRSRLFLHFLPVNSHAHSSHAANAPKPLPLWPIQVEAVQQRSRTAHKQYCRISRKILHSGASKWTGKQGQRSTPSMFCLRACILVRGNAGNKALLHFNLVSQLATLSIKPCLDRAHFWALNGAGVRHRCRNI